jgi:hypothetical protein
MLVEGRATLTSGIPVTTSDTTGGTIYFTPCGGNNITLWDGSNWTNYTFSEVSVAVPATTNTAYDVFGYVSSSTLALDTPLAWTNTTTRATSLVVTDGVLTKSGAKSRLYLFSFMTGGTSGVVPDTANDGTSAGGGQRYLFNMYNQAQRHICQRDTTGGWTYTTGTWRQQRATSSNKFEIFVGQQGGLIDITNECWYYDSNGTCAAACGIGVNSTSANSSSSNNYADIGVAGNNLLLAKLIHYPSLGYSYYCPLEICKGGSPSFYGKLNSGEEQTGMNGILWC